jgi:hypothetical protein
MSDETGIATISPDPAPQSAPASEPQPSPFSEEPAKPFTMEWLEQNRSAPRETAPATEAVGLSDELIIAAAPFTEEDLRESRNPQRAAPVKPAKFDAATLVGNFFDKIKSGDDDDRAVGLLERLYDHSYTAYERLVDAVAEHAGDYLAQQLSISRPSHISEEEMRQIPKHLRATAAALPPNIWDNLAWADHATRVQVLEGALELEQQREELYKAEERAYEEKIKQAAKRADGLAKQISDEHEAQHVKGLRAWTPFGKDEQQNQTFRDLVMREAVAAMQSDPGCREYYQEAHRSLRLAEAHRMGGDHQMANVYVEHARELARTWNQAFEQRLRSAQQFIGPLIRDALAWRAHQKAPKPKETQPARG